MKLPEFWAKVSPLWFVWRMFCKELKCACVSMGLLLKSLAKSKSCNSSLAIDWSSSGGETQWVMILRHAFTPDGPVPQLFIKSLAMFG